MLYFATGDDATDHNLRRLDHLASLDRFDGDAEQMHGWLIAAMDSTTALPKVVARHFTSYYFLGDAHFRASSEHRADIWRRLVAELRTQVDSAFADPDLKRDGPNGRPSVADRRRTLGERIIALCDELETASWGSSAFTAILARIDAIAVVDVRGDISELRRLTVRKRIADVRDHEYWIYRHIQHMRLVAAQLHHLT